ncbi:hypothetical protein BASA60_004519 [Batrachochytrium salamandrivorans]|nr:hypothetical protein BASA60_004519 [Batrachochytrium salamandrivorans]
MATAVLLLSRTMMTTEIPPTSTPAQTQVPIIFDRAAKRRQRDRSALGANSRLVDYLKDEMADRLVDRFLDIKRQFGTVLIWDLDMAILSSLRTPETIKKL